MTDRETVTTTARNPLGFTEAEQAAVDIATIRTGLKDPSIRLLLGAEGCRKWRADLAQLEVGL